MVRLPAERAWWKRSEREGYPRVGGRRTDGRRCSDLLISTRGALVENSMEPAPTSKVSIIAKANSSGAYEELLVADTFLLMRTTKNRE